MFQEEPLWAVSLELSPNWYRLLHQQGGIVSWSESLRLSNFPLRSQGLQAEEQGVRFLPGYLWPQHRCYLRLPAFHKPQSPGQQVGVPGYLNEPTWRISPQICITMQQCYLLRVTGQPSPRTDWPASCPTLWSSMMLSWFFSGLSASPWKLWLLQATLMFLGHVLLSQSI